MLHLGRFFRVPLEILVELFNDVHQFAPVFAPKLRNSPQVFGHVFFQGHKFQIKATVGCHLNPVGRLVR